MKHPNNFGKEKDSPKRTFTEGDLHIGGIRRKKLN